MIEFVVKKEFEGCRLDKYIKAQGNETLYSRSLIEKLIQRDRVSVNSKSTIKCSHQVKTGDTVNVVIDKDFDAHKELPKKEFISLDVLYEDEYLAIIDKPAGLTVHPAPGNYTGTLVNALLYHFDKNLSFTDSPTHENAIRPGIVHRLDKDTSGLMIITKDNKIHYEMSKLFANREVFKSYFCLCMGVPAPLNGVIDLPIGRNKNDRKKMAIASEGKNAISYYQTIVDGEYFAAIEVKIETGRTHQIRVHFDAIGHPILGDSTYNTLNRALNSVPQNKQKSLRHFLTKSLKRQALHAWKIRFTHPVTKKELEFIADIPKDLTGALAFLKENFEHETIKCETW